MSGGWRKFKNWQNLRFSSAAWREFLTQLALLTNVEAEDGNAAKDDTEKLKLSTIHQAKGLEFDASVCDHVVRRNASVHAFDGKQRRRGGGATVVLPSPSRARKMNCI